MLLLISRSLKNLYGREAEIDRQSKLFQEMTDSEHRFTKALLLVKGYSGIGKSALVHEIYPPLTAKRGTFISGKFDALKKDTPYSIITQAFHVWVKQILHLGEDQLSAWRTRVQNALGEDAQIVLEVLPELERLIGEQPKMELNEAKERELRFYHAFEKFIQLFCSDEHPLVVFLDDLQWADSGSLAFMQWMMTKASLKGLFLVGAYRDNEVQEAHPLLEVVGEIKNSNVIVEEVTLSNLNFNHVKTMLKDSLHREIADVVQLAQLLQEKLRATPFINQFLKELYSNKDLYFKSSSEGIGWWDWDVSGIQAANYADNVIDLMVSRINHLDLKTKDILMVASCLCNAFSAELLGVTMKTAEVIVHLERLLVMGLLKVSDEAFPLVEEGLIYKFLHDRIQQSGYSLIEIEQREKYHLEIGRALKKQLEVFLKNELMFEMVNQLNEGKKWIEDDEEMVSLAKSNIEAGVRSIQSMAYHSAQQYLHFAEEILSLDVWTQNPDLAYDLYSHKAHAAYLLRDYANALQYSKLIIDRIRPFEKV